MYCGLERFGVGRTAAVEAERGQALRGRRGVLHLLLGSSRHILSAAAQTVSHVSQAISRRMSLSMVRHEQQLGLPALSQPLLNVALYICLPIHWAIFFQPGLEVEGKSAIMGLISSTFAFPPLLPCPSLPPFLLSPPFP